MEAGSPILQRWELMRERLDEHQRRAFAATAAKVIGRGGVSQVVAASGMARNTVMVALQGLEGLGDEFMAAARSPAAGPTRRSGGGRKAATYKDPSLVAWSAGAGEPDVSRRPATAAALDMQEPACSGRRTQGRRSRDQSRHRGAAAQGARLQSAGQRQSHRGKSKSRSQRAIRAHQRHRQGSPRWWAACDLGKTRNSTQRRRIAK